MESADLKTIRFHDLRHSAATLMARLYPNAFDVKEYLGHSSLDITMRYVHHKPQASAANAMSELIARSKRAA